MIQRPLLTGTTVEYQYHQSLKPVQIKYTCTYMYMYMYMYMYICTSIYAETAVGISSLSFAMLARFLRIKNFIFCKTPASSYKQIINIHVHCVSTYIFDDRRTKNVTIERLCFIKMTLLLLLNSFMIVL